MADSNASKDQEDMEEWEKPFPKELGLLKKALDDHQNLLTCPICKEGFKTAMSLPCGHTFCSLCIRSALQGTHGNQNCPSCKARSAPTQLKANRALDDCTESFRKLKPSLLEFINSSIERSQAREQKIRKRKQKKKGKVDVNSASQTTGEGKGKGVSDDIGNVGKRKRVETVYRGGHNDVDDDDDDGDAGDYIDSDDDNVEVFNTTSGSSEDGNKAGHMNGLRIVPSSMTVSGGGGGGGGSDGARKKEPLPMMTLNVDYMKGEKLRAACRARKLDITGTDKELRWRLRTYRVMVEAECDKEESKRCELKDLAQKVRRQERASNKSLAQQKKNAAVLGGGERGGDEQGQENVVVPVAMKSKFAELINEVKERNKQKQPQKHDGKNGEQEEEKEEEQQLQEQEAANDDKNFEGSGDIDGNAKGEDGVGHGDRKFEISPREGANMGSIHGVSDPRDDDGGGEDGDGGGGGGGSGSTSHDRSNVKRSAKPDQQASDTGEHYRGGESIGDGFGDQGAMEAEEQLSEGSSRVTDVSKRSNSSPVDHGDVEAHADGGCGSYGGGCNASAKSRKRPWGQALQQQEQSQQHYHVQQGDKDSSSSSSGGGVVNYATRTLNATEASGDVTDEVMAGTSPAVAEGGGASLTQDIDRKRSRNSSGTGGSGFAGSGRGGNSGSGDDICSDNRNSSKRLKAHSNKTTGDGKTMKEERIHRRDDVIDITNMTDDDVSSFGGHGGGGHHASPQVNETDATWACQQCTYYNTGATEFCDMCGFRRPYTTRSFRTVTSGQDGGGAGSGGIQKLQRRTSKLKLTKASAPVKITEHFSNDDDN